MRTIEKKPVTHLVEHELALKVYLDALLLDDSAVAETAPSVETGSLNVQSTDTKQHETAVKAAESVAVAPPEWKDSTFECLMFKVVGSLALSVPLPHLNGILPWEDDVIPMPGYAEWFLGLLQHRGRQVKVIDIAKFVIPQNHSARASLAQERKFKHIVLIDGGKFGLACDDLGDVMTLNKDQVRWRNDRTHRPWLAGTVIDQMSALVDIDQLVAMLKGTSINS